LTSGAVKQTDVQLCAADGASSRISISRATPVFSAARKTSARVGGGDIGPTRRRAVRMEKIKLKSRPV